MKLNKCLGFAFIILGLVILLANVNIYLSSNQNNLIIEKQTKDYLALIEIPKINLKKALFAINDENNNVDKNVFVHQSSIFPDSDITSRIILAAHSGMGYNAFFKDLYKLKINDSVNIYYHDNIYQYEIEEIEYQDKTGTLYLKEKDYSDLILITCTYQDKKTQTIYYAKLNAKI